MVWYLLTIDVCVDTCLINLPVECLTSRGSLKVIHARHVRWLASLFSFVGNNRHSFHSATIAVTDGHSVVSPQWTKSRVSVEVKLNYLHV